MVRGFCVSDDKSDAKTCCQSADVCFLRPESAIRQLLANCPKELHVIRVGAFQGKEPFFFNRPLNQRQPDLGQSQITVENVFPFLGGKGERFC